LHRAVVLTRSTERDVRSKHALAVVLEDLQISLELGSCHDVEIAVAVHVAEAAGRAVVARWQGL
jgi:hypothetical protein